MTAHELKMTRLRDGRDWTSLAACVDEDPELFFPVGGAGDAEAKAEQARAVCRRCDVSAWCLQLALKVGAEDGVWGGTTPQERKRVRIRSRSTRRSSLFGVA